ncbi:hypothetical protein AB0F03_37325 [Streptomyces sp. NPDC028722]|uniref:hypothetical protein n=1 Tax=Streptomyces sp. NPDC028722 TaxID=3155016 RepID=UPI0033E756A4
MFVLTAGLSLCRYHRDILGTVERLAAGEEPDVDRGRGADTQGVTLTEPYGDAVVERGALVGLQLGRAEEVGDLARHVEGDRQL